MKTATTVQELHLYDSNIVSLSDVRDLPFFVNLQVLNLHSNHISSISLLPDLIHLRELNLSSNDISSMQGLHRLERLEILNLASNRIREVSGLEGMGNLRKVNLSFNSITSLAGFTALNGPHARLQNVDLRGNRIASLDELKSLTRCPRLRYLALQMDAREPSRSNPVCSLSGYRAKAYEIVPSLFSLDGYDVNMKPIHESEEDVQNFPSLAPYMEFIPEYGVRRPVSAQGKMETPHIDQVLQRHSARRPPSATHYKSDRDPGSKNNRPQKQQNVKERDRVDQGESPEPPTKSNHEERLSKLEAQLAARLSARSQARARRANAQKLPDDTESSISIDEDFGSTVDDTSSVASSILDEYRRGKAKSTHSEKVHKEVERKELPLKPIYQSQGVQTDTPTLQTEDIENHPSVLALYEEIGSLQNELTQCDSELQRAHNKEKDHQTTIQQAAVREHGLRETLAHEKDLVKRQNHQITTLQRQVDELATQLRSVQVVADAAEDQRRTLQSAMESLRAVCDTEKEHNKQKETQIERLTALLRDRQGEESSQKDKEGELLLELQRLQMQSMVYQKEAEDARELKRERQAFLEQEASMKEEKLKLQNIIQNYQSATKNETAKLRELQKAYEELAHSHAELKQVARAAVHKEGQASALVQELSVLVKKLKHKEQKLQRNFQFVEEERDALLDKLHQLHDEDYDPVIVDKERKNVKRELDQLLNERDTLFILDKLQIASLQNQLNGRPSLTDVQDLRIELENKTDALRIKDKMLDDQNDTIHQLKSAIQEKEQELARSHKLEDELNSVYDQLEDIKYKYKQIQTESEKKDTSLREMEKALTEMEEECDSLHASGKRKNKQIQELEERYAMVEHTIRQLREESEKLFEEEAKRAALLTQQINELQQQKQDLEQENGDLQVQLQQATQDAAALVALADKMRKKDKAARARGAKARSQLDQLHRMMTSIVQQQDLFMGQDSNISDGDDDAK